jgi:hypothetical protein
MLEELDLSGSAGVTGPLSASWPQWMPYLKKLSLSGATNLVGVRNQRVFYASEFLSRVLLVMHACTWWNVCSNSFMRCTACWFYNGLQQLHIMTPTM